MGIKFPKHHLVSAVLQKGVKVGDVISRAGGRREDVYIDEGQCGSPEVSLDCQNFSCVVIRKYVIVRHPVQDGVVDESDKSSTAVSGRAITPDSFIACEFLEKGVHAEFGLLHTGDQLLVTMQEV